MKSAASGHTVSRSYIAHSLLIVFLGFLAYSNTFNVPFVFDDIPNIVKNNHIKALSNFWPPSGTRWLGYLTFAMSYHLGKLNVTGYHIFNLAVHITNAVLVYNLVLMSFKTPSMLRPGQSSGPAAPTALFSALLFTVHPIQTQAVTYIVQRFASLATMFYLLSLIAYVKFRLHVTKHGIRGRKPLASYLVYPCSLLFAILAMKTKETAFTLPLIIILYESVFFEGEIKRRMLYLFPFISTILLIPLSLKNAGVQLGSLIGYLDETSGAKMTISGKDYLFTQFRVIVTYIRLLFAPINQSLDYNYPVFRSFLNAPVVLSFAINLLIVFLGFYFFYRYRRTSPALRLIFFGIIWFFVTLSVTSSIILIKDVIFEHRIYLPSVGAIIAIIASANFLSEKLKKRHPAADKIFVLISIIVLIIFFCATIARNAVWNNDITLWKDVVRKSPLKARGYIGLGNAYWERRQADEAIRLFQYAVILDPGNALAFYNIGNIYAAQGKLDKAAVMYGNAVKIKPGYVNAHNNLGNVYVALGRPDEAIVEYKTALESDPGKIDSYHNLGNAYAAGGKLAEAISEYKTALKLDPDDADIHNDLGIVYERQERIDRAVKEFETALRLNPELQAAADNLNRVRQKVLMKK